MTRIQEKVKDLIDVRPYGVVQDFNADPALTLGNYQFTDITADLMSQWLDRIVETGAQTGAAVALAGYRGVGKSHFLATLGAIIGHLELRSRIPDQHVAASAQRLKRRRYPVAYVRRGVFDNFVDELRAAISRAFEMDVTPIDSLEALLRIAAERAEELPFVLIVDTAFERASRVSRDDGPILSEIAELAKTLNMFVGVALDDDIAGADGTNAAITQTYTIDFLDQEHLYRIVNNHIFPKYRQAGPLLHQIYTNFRTILPSFRWSEQRFTSLYPLHPIILEIAPYVRLYAQDFALLSFSADAGRKILGRPANSLIALDEVFDSVESSLREVEDLREAFVTYDKLNADVVADIPVMQRMQAKLILKGLFLLSLDGYGTTVGEISSAMLIFDETDPQAANRDVQGLLERFVKALPDRVERLQEDEREGRYSLRVSSKENLNNALEEAVGGVSGGVIPKILRRIARDKFPEWVLAIDTEGQHADLVDCQVVWRGGIRRGRINWDLEARQEGSTSVPPADPGIYDWEVLVNPFDQPAAGPAGALVPRIFWKPAPLRKDEADTILRYFVLLTNATLREEYGEQWQIAGHAHTIAVEKIWTRIFIENAKFVVDGVEREATDEGMIAFSLPEMISGMIEPLFELHYPNHPYFGEPLGMIEVSALVNDFFSGARPKTSEVQRLVKTFALPLDLVELRGDSYSLKSEESIIKLPLVQEVLSLVNLTDASRDTVTLSQINAQLRQSPFGLMRESQYLILAGLVAQRQVEFVTSKGDRINRRSLDLKIIWEDIVGIAKPSSQAYGGKRLADWARILTGASDFHTIDFPEDQLAIKAGFTTWLDEWEKTDLLARFDLLPDEILNTRIWRFSTNAKKTFGAVAGIVREVVDETISIEEGLYRIADAFSDSEEVFDNCSKDLIVLEDFINTAGRRASIWNYLAVCDTTSDQDIEHLRERLLQLIDKIYFSPSEDRAREMDNLWRNFFDRFTAYYADRHDSVMKSHLLRERFEEIRKSDEWWEFENLSSLPVFSPGDWNEATRICGHFKELDCRFDVREMLREHPFCACSFSLNQMAEWEKLPRMLEETIRQGRRSHRNVLRNLNRQVIPLMEQFRRDDRDGEFTEAIASLTGVLSSGEEIPLLTPDELIILQKVLASLPSSAPVGSGGAGEADFNEPSDLPLPVN